MPPVGRQSAVRIARPKKWLDTAGLLMEVADGSPGQSFLTSDTLASMSISYDHVDSVANEPFNWQQAMARRELL